jgi:hypothetical protein
MPEKNAQVVPIMVVYECDDCGQNQMLPSGRPPLQLDPNQPPKLEHICQSCSATKDFEVQYPYIKHVPVPPPNMVGNAVKEGLGDLNDG